MDNPAWEDGKWKWKRMGSLRTWEAWKWTCNKNAKGEETKMRKEVEV